MPEDRMDQLKAMAADGYAPAIWAVAEIERLRAQLQPARAALADIGTSKDMSISTIRAKATRIYNETK